MLWLAGIAAGLLALLAVPVDVVFAVRPRERLQVRVRWLFGLVTLPAPGGRTPKGRRKKPKKKRRGRGGVRRALAVLRSEGLVRRALRTARDLLARVHLRRLDLDLRVGLDDPADTGRLWGIVGPLGTLLPRLPEPARVAVTPDFTNAVLEVEGGGEARVVPLALLAVLAAFALSPPAWRAAWAAARA